MNGDIRNWVSSTLESHGCASGPLGDRSGWNNQVFLSPTHVMRVSSGRFFESFAHEVRTIELVSGEVSVPEVIASGTLDDREWIIMERVAEEGLAQTWAALANVERREVISQLAANLKALHNIEVPADYRNPWITRAISEPIAKDLYLVNPEDYSILYQCVDKGGRVDPTLLDSCNRYVNDRLGLFDNDTDRLIHGDIHFDNLAWSNERLVLLDWELATCAAPDRELQAVIELVEDSQVIAWLVEDYPELFALSNLNDRLGVYAVMRGLHKLNARPAEQSEKVAAEIERVLSGAEVFSPG